MNVRLGAALAAAALVFSALSGCSGTEVPDPEDYAFSGAVKSMEGAPVVGARVIALRLQGPVDQQAAEAGLVSTDTVFTGEKGRFSFERNLAQGKYDLFIEDTSAQTRNRPMQRAVGYSDEGVYKVGSVQLAPASMLLVAVKDADYPALASQAYCAVAGTPYAKRAGPEGIVFFFLPAGTYQVDCYAFDHDRPMHQGQTEVSLAVGDSIQTELNLLPNANETPSLPPPSDLAVDYDPNSGIAKLTWSPVSDPRLYKYGVGRADYDLGGWPDEFTTFYTYYPDAPFDRADSVQQKTLQYSVYSMKLDALGERGARRTTVKVTLPRPWAYGPRIDSLASLLPPGGYHAGDTVRIVAQWTNRVRGNDSLYWRVGGGVSLRQAKAQPPASGKDTLSFVLPDTGDYEVGLSIRDQEGYRSCQSVLFRF